MIRVVWRRVVVLGTTIQVDVVSLLLVVLVLLWVVSLLLVASVNVLMAAVLTDELDLAVVVAPLVPPEATLEASFSLLWRETEVVSPPPPLPQLH